MVTALCGSENGLSFGELKTLCNLTDGNLNRHLKALAEVGAVRIHKTQSGLRRKTIIRLTDRGREELVDYLHTLEAVLHQAAVALQAEEKGAFQPISWKSNWATAS